VQRGVIRYISKWHGFGLIRVNGFKDLAFHRTDVQDIEFDSLREGQSVEFEVYVGFNGLRAIKVKVISEESALGKETSVKISPERR